MSVTKPNKKQVLQQSNCNYEVTNDKEDVKTPERTGFQLKNKEELLLERENQCSPQKKPEKPIKSEARKLRSIRLDLSSLKRGVIQKANGNWRPIRTDVNSDESSEDELKKKQKPLPEVPSYVANVDGESCRKPRQIKQEPLLLSSQTPTKLTPKSSQPLSIARRNARERNRVKQVNEGFASLRSRIPEYISEAYNEEKKRKSAKKLSKVETLRMAVDYIRHLETLLDLKSTEKDVWIKQIKTETEPWTTPNSTSDYPSPAKSKYVDSPGPSYEPNLEYQNRILYDYDYNYKDSVSPEKRSPPTFQVVALNENDNQCVDEFNYYETLQRMKKENNENEEGMIQEGNDIENIDVTNQEPEPELLPKETDLILRVSKKSPTILPPIKESFNKTISIFF